jgi:hypothetical protein
VNTPEAAVTETGFGMRLVKEAAGSTVDAAVLFSVSLLQAKSAAMIMIPTKIANRTGMLFFFGAQDIEIIASSATRFRGLISGKCASLTGKRLFYMNGS